MAVKIVPMVAIGEDGFTVKAERPPKLAIRTKAETVRAELQTVEERLRIFERLVATLESSQLLLGASVLVDTLVVAIPELVTMGEAGDRRAEQAAAEAVEVLSSLRISLGKFVENRSLLSVTLRRGLIPAVYNQCHARKQELAALESSEPKENLFERVAQAARESLALRFKWA